MSNTTPCKACNGKGVVPARKGQEPGPKTSTTKAELDKRNAIKRKTTTSPDQKLKSYRSR